MPVAPNDNRNPGVLRSDRYTGLEVPVFNLRSWLMTGGLSSPLRWEFCRRFSHGQFSKLETRNSLLVLLTFHDLVTFQVELTSGESTIDDHE